MALVVKNVPANAGEAGYKGSVCGLGRSPGVGNCSPLHILSWKIAMGRGVWWTATYSPWDCKESGMTEDA